MKKGTNLQRIQYGCLLYHWANGNPGLACYQFYHFTYVYIQIPSEAIRVVMGDDYDNRHYDEPNWDDY